jgi:hypothetical protein
MKRLAGCAREDPGNREPVRRRATRPLLAVVLLLCGCGGAVEGETSAGPDGELSGAEAGSAGAGGFTDAGPSATADAGAGDAGGNGGADAGAGDGGADAGAADAGAPAAGWDGGAWCADGGVVTVCCDRPSYAGGQRLVALGTAPAGVPVSLRLWSPSRALATIGQAVADGGSSWSQGLLTFPAVRTPGFPDGTWTLDATASGVTVSLALQFRLDGGG